MSTTTITLLPEYLRFLETGEPQPGLFAPDVLFDMNVPGWRVQVRGVDEMTALRAQAGGRWDVRLGSVVATRSGFVAETDYDAVEGGQRRYFRTMAAVTVRDERITEIVYYCTGPWDEATRRRHAREAPTVRAGM